MHFLMKLHNIIITYNMLKKVSYFMYMMQWYNKQVISVMMPMVPNGILIIFIGCIILMWLVSHHLITICLCACRMCFVIYESEVFIEHCVNIKVYFNLRKTLWLKRSLHELCHTTINRLSILNNEIWICEYENKTNF